MKKQLVMLLCCIGYSAISLADGMSTLDRDVTPTEQSQLALCNHSGKSNIYAAYAANEGTWTTHGWYSIKDGECAKISLGTYRGDVFVYGEYNGGELIWGDGSQNFCVNIEKAFVLKNADTECAASPELKNPRFGQEFPIVPGVNTYNFKL
jgi:uncharacterized membrane protein